MFHHTFTNGRIQMDGLTLDLSKMDAKDALMALDILDDQAFDLWKDVQGQIADARLLIQNTGSIHGNAVAVPVDISGSDRWCGECSGKGYVAPFNEDTQQHVGTTCRACGGSKVDGPVIRS